MPGRALMPEVKEHDPALALNGGPDGLGAYREIFAAAAELLCDGGVLMVEIGADQAGPVGACAVKAGLISSADQMRKVADLAGHARVTPMLESPFLNEIAGRRVLVKAECLQRTGSFKFRGGWSAVSALPEADRKRGVIAYSSGNHALSLSYAAGRRGIPCNVVMPRTAPQAKKDAVRGYGGRVEVTRDEPRLAHANATVPGAQEAQFAAHVGDEPHSEPRRHKHRSRPARVQPQQTYRR